MSKIISQRFILPVLLLISCSITSCTTLHTQDSGPLFYVNEKKIPNAVPKAEPLSKIGNKSYQVHGKKYQILHSRKNYVAFGIASWYGSKFNNRFTANGERYDMLAMTAAHRTLPLPTYVKVTNLTNGKQVIVKVNDRGPFKYNRIIDLSYIAAKKLGIIKHGTALVKIQAFNFSRQAHHHRPSFLL